VAKREIGLAISLVILSIMLGVLASYADLVISEIDYDQIGTDSAEWVEIHNPDSSPVSLSEYSLVFINGANMENYQVVDLTPLGTLLGGAYIVIGNTDCTSMPLTPATNCIQNGSPDIIQLRYMMEHLIYGIEYENDGDALLPGDVVTPEGDNNVDVGVSLQLCNDAWAVADITPCAAPVCGLSFVGEPTLKTSTWGFLKAIYRQYK